MKWFKHYSDASKSSKLNLIVDKFGLKGYAMYWLIVELLAEKFDGEDPTFEVHFNTIKQTLRVYHNKIIKDFMESVDDVGLMSVQCDSNLYHISFPKLLEIKDNHTKNLQVKNKKVTPRIEKNKIKNKIKNTPLGSNVIEFQDSKNEISNELFDSIIEQWNKICADNGKLKFHKGLKRTTLENFVELVRLNKSLRDIQSWKDCFHTIKNNDFLNGQNPSSSFVCTLSWLIDTNKIVDVLNGQYGALGVDSDLSSENLDERYEKYLEQKRKERIARGVLDA